MRPCVHFRVSLQDLSIGSDYIGNALCAFVFRTFTSAIRQTNLPFRIAQKGIRKVVVLGKLCIGRHIIRTDTENLNAFFFVSLDSITESDPFRRSPTRAGARVEPQNDRFASVIAEATNLSRVRLNFEFRGGFSNLQHQRPPFRSLRDRLTT